MRLIVVSVLSLGIGFGAGMRYADKYERLSSQLAAARRNCQGMADYVDSLERENRELVKERAEP